MPKFQLMGNLFAYRVTFNKPFCSIGIDFAKRKWFSSHGSKTTQAYVAVFICLATKAIHLELVSDLSAAAWVAVIKWLFTEEENASIYVYSDYRINFVAAGKELQMIYEAIENEAKAYLDNEGIIWHHISPSSPHLGGLWKAGVKSVRRYSIKTLDETLLHLEEGLNSHPSAPLRADINDKEALIPDHFLTGCS